MQLIVEYGLDALYKHVGLDHCTFHCHRFFFTASIIMIIFKYLSGVDVGIVVLESDKSE